MSEGRTPDWRRCRATDYGFEWGAMSVTRTAVHRGTAVLTVVTSTGQSIDVYVSRTGRSLRVFKDGHEMRRSDDA